MRPDTGDAVVGAEVKISNTEVVPVVSLKVVDVTQMLPLESALMELGYDKRPPLPLMSDCTT